MWHKFGKIFSGYSSNFHHNELKNDNNSLFPLILITSKEKNLGKFLLSLQTSIFQENGRSIPVGRKNWKFTEQWIKKKIFTR